MGSMKCQIRLVPQFTRKSEATRAESTIPPTQTFLIRIQEHQRELGTDPPASSKKRGEKKNKNAHPADARRRSFAT